MKTSPQIMSKSAGILAVFFLFCLFLVSVSEAVLVKSEEIDLSSKSSPHASIQNFGGSFTSEGWRSGGGQDHVVTKLNKAIGPNDWAAVELHLTNFDIAKNKPEQITTFFAVYNTPNGKPLSGTPGTYISMRTKGPISIGNQGFGCTKNGEWGQAFRAVYRPTAKGNKLENMGGYGCLNRHDPSKVYRFRIEFKSHRLFIYRDDVLIWGNPAFNRATPVSYVFAGQDKHTGRGYGSFAGVVYKKIVVYRDNGKPEPPDPILQQDHIRLNVGGYDDMVEGWPSAVRYATKGREFQWSQAFSTEGVANAAPLDVYKTVLQMNHHYDTKKLYQVGVEMKIPIPDGNWNVRLHFIDILTPTRRSIDVDLNGKRVIENMDIRTEAGGHLKALVKEFPVAVAGGRGLTVFLNDDENDPPHDYFMCGIEMIKAGATPARAGTSKLRARMPSSLIRVENGGLRITGLESGTYTLRVTDAAGRCRASTTISGSTLLQARLEPGWYRVRIERNGEKLQSRVFVRP